MNRPLASLFLLVSLLSSITVAQTGTKKQRTERPASRGDLKICQGVSIPDGYIIVGYVTSPGMPAWRLPAEKTGASRLRPRLRLRITFANPRLHKPKRHVPQSVQSAHHSRA